MPELTFQRHDATTARQARDTVARIHLDSYAERIASGSPFHAPDAFMSRFDAYASNPGFDLLIAFRDDDPAGQAWGWALGPGTTWWNGLTGDTEPGFTDEDGTRTFALSEIMVRQEHTRQHVARALHDELLARRHETRATLLVNPANDTAQRIYTRWGWQEVARLRPAWPDAPLFNVLILPLADRAPGQDTAMR